MEEGTIDKIVGAVALGFLFLMWWSSKTQQPQQPSTVDKNTNVNSYHEIMKLWKPLNPIPSVDNITSEAIKSLKPSSKITSPNPVPPIEHTTPVPPIEHTTPVPPIEHTTPVPPIEHTPPISPVEHTKPVPPIEQPLGINEYSNHEYWRVIRGLDRKIVGYKLERNAEIKST